MRFPFRIACLALTLLPAAAAAAERPAAGRPVVVELFTSQGCSSCPPADRYLTELAQSRGDVLALAFHITYWNYLGWRDPYAFQAATDRQTAYANRLSESKLFTPQMVVEGTKSLWGSNRGEAADAIRSAKGGHETSATMRIVREGDQMRVSVGEGEGRGRVLLVGYDHAHRTAIGRGENTGHTLVESNIVRSMSTLGTWSGSAMTLTVATPAGEEAAVLLQAPDGRIVGAAKLSS